MAPVDDASRSNSISIDSDVAFTFVDFSGVDFGDHEKADKGTQRISEEEERNFNEKNQNKNEQKLQSLSDISHGHKYQNQNGYSEEVVKCNDTEKYQKRKEPKLKYIDMPDGQNLQQRHTHDPDLFKAQSRRVQNLCQWYELGIRPSLSSSSLLNLAAHENKDEDLFDANVDDLKTLLLRSIEAQDDLNTNLPPHPRGEYEDVLKVAPSTIKGAGNGLFAVAPIPKEAILCHYTGYRHHYQSQKRLKGKARAYVLKLQNGWPKYDRRNDGFVDAFSTKDVLARFINDPRLEERCNVTFKHIQEPGIWHCPVVSLRDIAAGEELLISYGPRYWSDQE
ncbi:hypothetical protein ACHAW5_006009 [Stephanodiscus triporus]|uniref:SET domain-containing protein n=1 Tax=Stephanodiscus triporus TaxID=2934178 RepID=A0ABD3QCK0_9STRA